MNVTDSNSVLERIGQLEGELSQLRRQLLAPVVREGFVDVLACLSGQVRLAFPVDDVIEVVPICRLDPHPEASPYVIGELNFHERHLPVLDLGAALGLKTATLSLEHVIVICHVSHRYVGLLVEQVDEVSHVALDSIEQEGRLPQLAPFVVGTYSRGDEHYYLLSTTALFESRPVRNS